MEGQLSYRKRPSQHNPHSRIQLFLHEFLMGSGFSQIMSSQRNILPITYEASCPMRDPYSFPRLSTSLTLVSLFSLPPPCWPALCSLHLLARAHSGPCPSSAPWNIFLPNTCRAGALTICGSLLECHLLENLSLTPSFAMQISPKSLFALLFLIFLRGP